MPRYARVLVDDSAGKAFDYELPEAVAAVLQPGARVRVPVRTRTALATVIELLEETDVPGVKLISEVVSAEPILSPLLLKLGAWISDYYCCSLEAAMKAVLPNVIRKAEVGHQTRLFARLAREVEEEELEKLRKKAPLQAGVIDHLTEAAQPVSVTELAEKCDASHAVVQALVKKGLIVTEAARVERDPFGDESFVHAAPLAMNPEQTAVFEHVRRAIDHPPDAAPKPLLLHGVTGSGKTEIYLQAIQLVLERGQTAIMLVPEISLTPQTVERFKSRFAATRHEVAVLHSHLSEGERHDEWHKIRDGRARIVIGARSAIFAPCANLGLIVVDEEHENTYKQEETPRYHGRDIAVLRASMEKCAILLGSATPSLESFHNAQTGKYELLRLIARVDDKKMPFIRIIDLRMESKKHGAILSERLITAINDRLTKKEQTILFLNRRGFSTSLICEKCGHVCECPNCSVALTFHRAAARMVCHICGYQAVAPQKCPECRDPGIKYTGTGTEKVEDSVSRLFPKAVIKRLDADVMQRREAFRETLTAFRTGKIDILVGTQMIAKGLHFPNVTLVGIINADLGLHLPDFRAGERTFQLLTQVAGRAGRGDVEGEVFVQSFTPFSPSIQHARHHDFDGFWEQEIEFRRQWDYPPFTHLVLIIVRSAHQQRGSFSAETLHRRLKEELPPGVTLSEPAPAPLEKSHGSYRFHLMMRTRSIVRLSRHLRAVLDKLTFPEDVFVTVDVDAYQLL
ncbi:primosomal protein N' [Chthoniobacter flavus Ellin428]|uniref:Replication restart protein PriA n=1 Tax=Chthoniobacter flavus Ellin428 TaxID=497964 RepID=B4D7U4_9BACT|nr:primosomal protein N' [Chthoniobacter flavus]EDY17467.1 primosomal protein N' [Chthoniobacter flavus Ellin428]TCO92263.1 replication restart DNA helicase PriA [Chthoniobacter flavus]